MKSFLFSLGAAAVLFAPGRSLRADEPKPANPPPTHAPAPGPEAPGKWNVRVEVLMLAMPEEKALSALPELRNDATVDATTAALLDALKHKEPGLTLTGYPVVTVLEGEQGTTETNTEKIYPTQFGKDGSPTTFEKRNMGPMLEVQATHVSEDGKWIQFKSLAARTELLGFDDYDAGPIKEGHSTGRIIQPRFFSSKNSDTLNLGNGQRILLGLHKLIRPEGQVELFILQASATPVR